MIFLFLFFFFFYFFLFLSHFGRFDNEIPSRFPAILSLLHIYFPVNEMYDTPISTPISSIKHKQFSKIIFCGAYGAYLHYKYRKYQYFRSIAPNTRKPPSHRRTNRSPNWDPSPPPV